jgi:Right handed beta helix region
MKRSHCGFRISLAGFISALLLAVSAEAATLTVQSAADAGGTCPGTTCTLRQAIATAASGDTINFSLPSGTTAIILTSDQLLINKNLTISGPGANLLSVQRSTAVGTPQFRIFEIDSSNVTISGLTIANGTTTVQSGGGGILASGTLTIANCTITGNSVSGSAAGGIGASGTVTITNSTISGNSANVGGGIYGAGTIIITNSTISGNTGGGIHSTVATTITITNCTISGNTATTGGGIDNTGTITITNSTVSGNTATTNAAGIYNTNTITVTNSTISGNTAAGNGGGVYNDTTGTVTFTSSTISGNSAGGPGGGIINYGNVTITNSTISANGANGGGGIAHLANSQNNNHTSARNTIIAKNTGNDFSGTLTSQGYNLIGNTSETTITGTTTGDQHNVDPLLGPLQDNGGPTFTQALLSGSTAIEGGNSSGSSTDQRGFTRPVDSPVIANASGGDGSDIGAYEVQGDQLPGCGNTLVTNNNDSGTGSLRFIMANLCQGETITFASSVVSPINLTSGELLIDKPMTISGPGANLMTVQRDPSASSNFSIFHVTASGATNISGLTITKGNPNSSGGGIFMQSSGGTGNTLSITDCVISGNTATTGGGIDNTGTVTITNSTISGNTASDKGGGIYNGNGGTITNCTISGNTAAGGGGMYDTGSATLINSTIAANTATQSSFGNGGGGIWHNSGTGTITVKNTIIATNTSGSSPDFLGNLTSQGFNLIGNDTGATITPAQFSDQIGTAGAPIDPLLGPLQDNGGPTPTLALLSGSRAIDKGDSSIDPITGNSITTDQRGVGYSRTVDDPSIPNAAGGDGTDIGAFEFGAHISVASRKTHGTAGTFDVPLPLTGTSGIECRSGGATNDHQLILTFPTSVTINGAPQAQVTTGTGQVGSAGSSNGGIVSITGGIVTVPLTNVSNAQQIAVTLFGVSDGVNTNDVVIPMDVLAGDTTANGSVNSSDIAQTQSQSGQPVTSSNFREDVTVNGSINSSDVAFVQSKSGTALPVAASQSQEDPITTTPKHRTSPEKSF